MILPRRKFLIGAATLLAAPAIVRYESLMRVKAVKPVVGAWHHIAFAEGEGNIQTYVDGTLVDELRVTKGVGNYTVQFAAAPPGGQWVYVSQHVSLLMTSIQKVKILGT